MYEEYVSLLPTLMALMLLTPIALASPIAIYWSFRQDPHKAKPLVLLSVAGLGVSAATATYIATTYPMEPIIYSTPWFTTPYFTVKISFSIDFLSRFMGLLAAWLAFIIGVYAIDYMAHDYRLGWYWFWYNTFAASMLLVAYANDLLLMFIGWEGLGLSSWALIGHWYKDDDELTFVGRVNDWLILKKPAWTVPSYAGWRAIATITFGDTPMLAAVGAIGILGGSLEYISYSNGILQAGINWLGIAAKLSPIGIAVLMLAFMLGPFTKSAQFPFNDWLLTAMTGPTTVSALLHSATMVAAGVYIFMRLTESIRLAGIAHNLGIISSYTAIIYIGLLTALLGALFATAVDERKVILAGSTMSSLGLMMGITALMPYFSHEVVEFGGYVISLPVFIAFMYLILHALAKATLFLVSGHLIHETHTRFNVGDLELARRMKLGFYAAIAAAISLGGVPPLAGYWIHGVMDKLVHHAIPEVGIGAYALLFLASLAYVAFLSRFVSLNFVKGGKPHVEHKEQAKLPFMVFAYTATGTAALTPIIVPLTIEKHLFIEAGLDPIFITIGVVLWIVFIIAFIRPRVGYLGLITKIFERRYYLQSFMDVILAEFGFLLTWSMYRGPGFKAPDKLFNFLIPERFGLSLVEKSFRGPSFKAVDRFLNFITPEGVLRLSRRVRTIQIGQLRTYLNVILSVVISIILVVLYIVYLMLV